MPLTLAVWTCDACGETGTLGQVHFPMAAAGPHHGALDWDLLFHEHGCRALGMTLPEVVAEFAAEVNAWQQARIADAEARARAEHELEAAAAREQQQRD
jgi:hypothetical protein